LGGNSSRAHQGICETNVLVHHLKKIDMLITIVGIIGIVVGAFLIIKTEWFLKFFGRIEWAETHLGTSGGTRLFYKLLGIAIIILSFMFMAGIVQLLLGKLFSRGRL